MSIELFLGLGWHGETAGPGCSRTRPGSRCSTRTATSWTPAGPAAWTRRSSESRPSATGRRCYSSTPLWSSITRPASACAKPRSGSATAGGRSAPTPPTCAPRGSRRRPAAPAGRGRLGLFRRPWRSARRRPLVLRVLSLHHPRRRTRTRLRRRTAPVQTRTAPHTGRAVAADPPSRVRRPDPAHDPARAGRHATPARLPSDYPATVAEPSPLNNTAYKHREDLIDALLCAWTAALWSRRGTDRCQILGPPGSGTPELAPTIIAPARPKQRR